MPDDACPLCGGERYYRDYDTVQHAIVGRKCLVCRGTGRAPRPKPRVVNPSKPLGLAAQSYAAYVHSCEEASMTPVGPNAWSTWRKRAGLQRKYIQT